MQVKGSEQVIQFDGQARQQINRYSGETFVLNRFKTIQALILKCILNVTHRTKKN